MKRYAKQAHVVLTFICQLLILCCCAPKPTLRVGLRSSSYGITPFPKPDWWLQAASAMSASHESAEPAVVWIVGNAQRGGECWLSFPIPEGKKKSDYENIRFAYTDRNMDYLDLFDESGLKVWLQVEPAAADVETLFTILLDQYSDHPSVIGVGVDVEWYRQEEFHEGEAITDAQARAWVDLAQTYDPEYQVFLKHWLPEKMPPSARDGLMFLDDSQGFENQDEMITEFSTWGETFSDGSVGFQYGYASDRKWWGHLTSPTEEIGHVILENIPNTTDLFWVDFTAEEIWPQE